MNVDERLVDNTFANRIQRIQNWRVFRSISLNCQKEAKRLPKGWFSNRTGTSADHGKAPGKDWTCMDGTFGSQFAALSLVKSQYVHTILDQSWELLHRGVHLSVRFPLRYCLDTNRCPPLKEAVNYLVGVHCSWLCQWSIYYRLSAEIALCHLLNLAALTWRLLFICLELDTIRC